MNDLQIIVLALKAEARSKPNERIYVGKEVFMYKDFSSMLDHNELEDFVKKFLKDAEKMYRENQAFRLRMIRLAGVDSVGE